MTLDLGQTPDGRVGSLPAALPLDRPSRVEVQVRTQEMHLRAESGDAAHAVYKGRLDGRYVDWHLLTSSQISLQLIQCSPAILPDTVLRRTAICCLCFCRQATDLQAWASTAPSGVLLPADVARTDRVRGAALVLFRWGNLPHP